MKDWSNLWTIAAMVKLAKVLILPAIGGGGWFTRKWLLSRSTHWPIVQGHVQGFIPGGDESMCALLYSYSVNGEYYSGEIPILKDRIFRSEDDVRMMLPTGSTIDVKYSPTKPERSVGLIPEMIQSGGFPV